MRGWTVGDSSFYNRCRIKYFIVKCKIKIKILHFSDRKFFSQSNGSIKKRRTPIRKTKTPHPTILRVRKYFTTTVNYLGLK